MHKTLFRSFTLLLFIALAVLMVTACGRSASETPVSPSNGETASYEMDAESAQTSGETSIHDSTGTGTQEPSLSANQTPPPTEKGEEVSASISVSYTHLDVYKRQGFGKARIKQPVDEKRKTTFADVAGADEEKEELREICLLYTSRCV